MSLIVKFLNHLVVAIFMGYEKGTTDGATIWISSIFSKYSLVVVNIVHIHSSVECQKDNLRSLFINKTKISLRPNQKNFKHMHCCEEQGMFFSVKGI